VEQGLSVTQLLLCHLKCTCRVTTSQDQARNFTGPGTKRHRKPVKITDLSDGKEYVFKTSKGAADFLGLLAPRTILYNDGKIWKNKFTGKSYKISK